MLDDCQHGLDETLLSRFVKRHFHNNRPEEILNIRVEWAAPKGVNFASYVHRIKIRCLTASGRKTSVSMIVKTEIEAGAHKEFFSALPSVFRIETKIYSVVLPLMEDLQEEFDDKRELLWPQMYGYEPYRLVALQDLTELEYVVAERRNRLDLTHALLVLRNMARFHAMSKVLLSRSLLFREDAGIPVLGASGEVAKAWWNVVITCLTESMIATWGQGWSAIADKVKKQMPSVADRVAKLAASYDDRFAVLNHGDLWTTNIMFRYTEFDHVPVSVRFIDFQMANVNSFIWDVEYFISSSVTTSVRRSEKDRLLQTYQNALEMNLKRFRYSGHIPSIDDVQEESKRVEYGAAVLLLESPIDYAETDEAVTLEKVLSRPPLEVIHESVYRDGKAKDGIGEDLKEFVAKGLF